MVRAKDDLSGAGVGIHRLVFSNSFGTAPHPPAHPPTHRTKDQPPGRREASLTHPLSFALRKPNWTQQQHKYFNAEQRSTTRQLDVFTVREGWQKRLLYGGDHLPPRAERHAGLELDEAPLVALSRRRARAQRRQSGTRRHEA